MDTVCSCMIYVSENMKKVLRLLKRRFCDYELVWRIQAACCEAAVCNKYRCCSQSSALVRYSIKKKAEQKISRSKYTKLSLTL